MQSSFPLCSVWVVHRVKEGLIADIYEMHCYSKSTIVIISIISKL